MKISVNVESPVKRTFRVDQVAGLFDVQLADKTRFECTVEVPDAPDPDYPITGNPFGNWKIGAIVGPSGSGKGQVARVSYGDSFLETPPGRPTMFPWPADGSILDGFPRELNMQDITGALNAVGFSSPPAWVLPYHALSTGQRMRCDLARALLLTDRPMVAFDEFTSTVDRQVGQFASAAVAKSIRQNRFNVRRFVAVTCHYDVLAWLEPDWVLDMATRTLARGSLRRPEIRLAVHRLGPRQGLALWPLFERHHYLSATLHPAARCYVGLVSADPQLPGVPVAFCATIPNAGHKGRRIVHRLVVLPDYQGLGIGPRLLNAAVSAEAATGSRISIRTSHPSLIAALARRPEWRVGTVVRTGIAQPGFSRRRGHAVGSPDRSTVSFVFSPQVKK